MIITVGRTIDLEKTARYGKLSPEYFENSAICIIHPKDMKRLGLKEGNLKISTSSGSVVVKGVTNEYETGEGVIVIANGPWANKLISKENFQMGQVWFKATVESTKEDVSTLENILNEITMGGN